MRINAQSSLTMRDVIDAIHETNFTYHHDIFLEEWVEGTRGAKQFYCASQHGKYTTGRNHSNLRSASWTAWGYVLAQLFNRDPNAHIGQYRGVDDFIAQIYDAQQRYHNRRAFGVRERPGEPGQDCSFLAIIGEGW